MGRFSPSLIDQIESGALDDRISLSESLRKCIALGGRSGSTELRDWARQELDGYRDDRTTLPNYRRLHAPIMIDGIQGAYLFENRQISAFELPDFARQAFSDGLAAPFGVGELERMAKSVEPTRLQPSGMEDLPLFMNSSGNYQASIHRVYFSVSSAAVNGVLDTIRTKLVSLVAEIRSAGLGPEDLPTAEAANQAVSVVIKGRARANIALGSNSIATAAMGDSQVVETPHTAWYRRPWAIATGASTVVGGVAGVGAWLGWNPFG